MKKLLSLLAVVGLVGSVAMPIYAQEEEINPDNELLIVAADDANLDDVVDYEIDYEASDDEAALEADEGEIIDDSADAEEEILDSEENVDESISDAMWKLDEEIELSEDWKAALEKLLNGEGTEENAKTVIHEWAMGVWLTDAQATMIAGFLVGFGLGWLLVIWIICVILRILGIVALWKAFSRAWEGGWKAIIPIYNTYIMYKLAGMKNWFWYIILIAVAFAIASACLPDYEEILTYISEAICGIISIVATFLFARKYTWGVFASILFVLFNPICILFLGFGNYPYEGKSKETVVEA